MQEEETKRLRLLVAHYREDIVKDLTVDHVLPALFQGLVLTYEDKQWIDKEGTSRLKAEKLLDILFSKSKVDSSALTKFKLSLESKYAWLYEKLCEDVPDLRAVPLTKTNENDVQSKGAAGASLEVEGIPCLPTVNIERKELSDVVNKLRSLKQNQYLVIQGMTGCGKSVLATQAVHKLLASKDEKVRVYWLSIGKDCNDNNDALLGKVRILCDKLDVNRAPKSLEQGKEILREAFITRPDTLLVLDNVWSHRVIRNFDIGCRIMVTTQDMTVMDVVNGRLAYSIQITEGFEQAESLDFFCEALHIPKIEDLPEQAIMIHNECKGSPMVISLIASLIEEHNRSETDTDASRWKHYYESLSKREFSGIKKIRPYEHASILDAISLSFDNLEEQYREYYQDFGVFQDDVEIPCQVLQTLWSKSKCETEDIMKYFVRKSMAIEQFDTVQKSYVYSVHDLQLDYLKHRLRTNSNGVDQEKELHEKFVLKYVAKCSEEFHKLPDDGYIHFHIGYHLFKAGRFDLFPKLYLDLKFIGEKMRITGPADVLIDFRRYGPCIVEDNEQSRKLLDELETFTQQVGYRMYGQSDIDIIQMAIQSPKLPHLSQLARQVAQAFPSRVFVEWRNSDSTQWKHAESTVLCGDSVCCAKFVGCRGNLFIAALSTGDVVLCDFTSSAVYHVFKGHSDSVNSLDVFCPETLYSQRGRVHQETQEHVFVSASNDKTCKLWDLTSYLQKFETKTEDLQNGGEGSTPSPKIRSSKLWSFNSFKDESYLSMEFHTAPVDHIRFSPDGTQVVSTSKNELLTWRASNGTVLFKVSSLEFTSCYFTLPPYEFLLGTCDNQLVAISQRPTTVSKVYAHHLKIVALLFRSEDYFCTVSENEIGLWRISKRSSVHDKTPRRTPVLSPRSSVPLTNGTSSFDSRNSEGNVGGSLGDFLHPDSAGPTSSNNTRSNRSSYGDIGGPYKLRSGRTSPTLSTRPDTLECFTTRLEVAGSVIQIVCEQSITKENRGLFNCAAIDSKYGEGDLLACGTYDHKIVLLQLDKLVFLGEFSAHNGWVTTLCFSPVDEFSLLSGSSDQTVKVWDVANEEKEETEPKKTGVFAAVPLDDSILSSHPVFVSVCATDRRTLQVYQGVHLLQESHSFPGRITCVGLLSDGAQGAAGTEDGQIFSLQGILGDKTSLKVSTLKLKEIGNHESQSEVLCLQFGSSNNTLATGSRNDILVFKDFLPHWRLPLNSKMTHLVGMLFCIRDSVLIICGDNGYIGVKDVDKKAHLNGLDAIKDVIVSCCAINKESQKLVIGSEGGAIRVFAIKKDSGIERSKSLECKHASAVRCVALSSGGDKLAVGHDNGLITIWDISTDVCIEDKDLILHKSPVHYLAFSQRNFGDVPWLLSCGDQLAFWTLEKSVDKLKRTTYMEGRRRRKSEETSRSSSRLSMEVAGEVKIGRQGKRDLLQTFTFHGNQAFHAVCDLGFTRFITVDDCGVFYILDIM